MQGPAGGPALGGEPALQAGRPARRAARARRRPGDARRLARRQVERGRPGRRAARLRAAAGRRAGLGLVRGAVPVLAIAGRAVARRARRASHALVRAAARTPARRRAGARRATCAQLARIAAGYAVARALPRPSSRSTRRTATSDEAGAPHLDEDYLILSTIHSAKGQEWGAVYVLNVVDGCIPSDMATGVGRRDRGGAPPALRRDDARQRSPAACSCRSASTCTQQRRHGDRHVYGTVTRFLPPQLQARFTRVTPRPPAAAAAAAAQGGATVDVSARVRSRWA